MLSERAKHELYVLAHDQFEQHMRMVNGMSGSDQSDSVIHLHASHAYKAMARGVPLAEAIVAEDVKFREAAREVNERVKGASKTERGPYQGQSSMHHRWLNPEGFEHFAHPHMLQMAQRAMALEGAAPEPNYIPPRERAGHVEPLPAAVVEPAYVIAKLEAKAASQAMKARRDQGETISPDEYEAIGKLWQKSARLHEAADRRIEAEQHRANAGSFIAAAARAGGKPVKPAKPLTFAQARDVLLAALRAEGWTVNAGLKVPKATAPRGSPVTLWFKTQAIYSGTTNDMGSARSYSSDMRDDARDPVRFATSVEANVLKYG